MGDSLFDQLCERIPLGFDQRFQGERVDRSSSFLKSVQEGVSVVKTDKTLHVAFEIMTQSERYEDLLKGFIVQGFSIDQDSVAVEYYGLEP